MTRKDYEVIARVFANRRLAIMGIAPGIERTCMLASLTGTAEAMARELLAASKFNNNGNKSFKVDVFLKACGVTA